MCARIVFVCIVGGGPGKHGALKVVFHYCKKGNLTHEVVVGAYIIFVCIVGVGGGC